MKSLPRVEPGNSGLLALTGQIWATMRAEVVMQWRRGGLWIAFACVAGLLLLLTVQAAFYLSHPPANSLYVREHYTPADFTNLVIYSTAIYATMFLGLVVALLAVDRLERDQRLGMLELQRAASRGDVYYGPGKFLGNYVAGLVPSLLIYLLCALTSLILGWPAVLLWKFMQAFVLVFVPASLAAVAVAFLLASFLPVRVVQVGFSLFWIYLNIGPGWHALVSSIFNPNGLYVFPIFFPLSTPMPTLFPDFKTSLQLTLLNIAVLCLTALVALCLTCGNLALRRYREERA